MVVGVAVVVVEVVVVVVVVVRVVSLSVVLVKYIDHDPMEEKHYSHRAT